MARKITIDEMQEAARLGYLPDGGECHITLPPIVRGNQRSCANPPRRAD